MRELPGVTARAFSTTSVSILSGALWPKRREAEGDIDMSEFVYLFRSTPAAQQAALGAPEAAQKSMQKWLAWIRELEAKGQLKHPGQPLAGTGKVVRGGDNKLLVTDGPFAEAKDIVLGFIVVEARDLEHAAEIATGCPMVHGGGAVEIRPVMQLQF
jgi:hypothetical protein